LPLPAAARAFDKPWFFPPHVGREKRILQIDFLLSLRYSLVRLYKPKEVVEMKDQVLAEWPGIASKGQFGNLVACTYRLVKVKDALGEPSVLTEVKTDKSSWLPCEDRLNEYTNLRLALVEGTFRLTAGVER
jgi:hypothetical protein